ncbi:hypothetical protein RvY_03624 [Ramazzottius varieornatus]|uniref:Uncharacterized protein n=1 Tax=Ramazzottius varieornatus TaxID=947166 RepID=A0A1D1UVU9_RAMVA|nr:hypothetical protein RvY_03624 [Ramazzottius varieornatus]
MKVRLFWTAAFNKSKATVYAVGDSFKDMERQFTVLEEDRKNKNKKLYKAPKKGKRLLLE